MGRRGRACVASPAVLAVAPGDRVSRVEKRNGYADTHEIKHDGADHGDRPPTYRHDRESRNNRLYSSKRDRHRTCGLEPRPSAVRQVIAPSGEDREAPPPPRDDDETGIERGDTYEQQPHRKGLPFPGRFTDANHGDGRHGEADRHAAAIAKEDPRRRGEVVR